MKEKSHLKYLQKKKYYYELMKIKRNVLDEIFNKAKTKYLKICNKLNINLNWEIKFFLYKNLTLTKAGKIKNKNNCAKVLKIRFAKNKGKVFRLNCFLDLNLFYLLLKNKHNWNMAIGGGLTLFQRKPNIYMPDILFSLNYLRT